MLSSSARRPKQTLRVNAMSIDEDFAHVWCNTSVAVGKENSSVLYITSNRRILASGGVASFLPSISSKSRDGKL